MHHLWQFWVHEQGVPGSLLGDLLIGAATYLVGKYRVAPWLHRRHLEHLKQNERQHQELMDLHRKHHQELLAAGQAEPSNPRSKPSPPASAAE